MLGDVIKNASDFLVLVVLFGVTIFVHEFGHFLVALRLGFVVETFSIGFGPAIWKRKFRGIWFKIGIVPVGGYVSLPQLDPSGMATIQGGPEEGKAAPAGEGKDPAAEEPAEPLPPIEPWKRILVSLAGAAGNVLLAVVLAWIVALAPAGNTDSSGTLIGFVSTNSVAHARGLRPGDEIVAVGGEAVNTWGDYATLCYLAGGRTNEVAVTVCNAAGEKVVVAVPLDEDKSGLAGIEKAMAAVITEVEPDSPAAAAGLLVGDRVRTFDGLTVASTMHFIQLIRERGGKTAPIEVERKHRRVALTVTPRYDSARGRAIIGAGISTAVDMTVMPWMVHRRPWDQLRGDASSIVRILKALVTPKESKQAAKGLGGPVLILATLWISIKISLFNAVGFLRFLNVNLAILNLLPIPVLDGGHILFSLWEGLTRRRLHPKFANVLVNAFAVMLILVFVLLTVMDVRRSPAFLRAIRGVTSWQDRAGTNGPPETVPTNSLPPAP
jgi:regulator of sigma E protease